MYPSTVLKDKFVFSKCRVLFFQSLLYLLYRDISEGKFQYHRKCKWYKCSQSKLMLTFTLVFAETMFHCASILHQCFDCKTLAGVN